jgi:hypothetical protein
MTTINRTHEGCLIPAQQTPEDKVTAKVILESILDSHPDTIGPKARIARMKGEMPSFKEEVSVDAIRQAAIKIFKNLAHITDRTTQREARAMLDRALNDSPYFTEDTHKLLLDAGWSTTGKRYTLNGLKRVWYVR